MILLFCANNLLYAIHYARYNLIRQLLYRMVGGFMYGLTVIGGHLSDFHQPGAPGLPSRLRLAHNAVRLWSAFLLCRICVHDHILHDGDFGFAQPAPDPQVPHKMDRDLFDRPDGAGAAGIFGFRSILAAFPVRGSVRPRRRIHRCGCQPLCGESLSVFRDELPSLLLRCRRRDQPVHHVPGAENGQMERGIPMDFLYPDGHPAGVHPFAAALEAE